MGHLPEIFALFSFINTMGLIFLRSFLFLIPKYLDLLGSDFGLVIAEATGVNFM
jgi:hypothetical protein